MKRLTFSMLLIASSLSFGQNHTPVTVTGYNSDVIAETIPAISTTDSTLDNINNVLYSQSYDLSGNGTGLPDNGLITSGSSSYQLNPYTAENCILLRTGQSDSLVLTTPASYSSLSLLGLSTEIDGTILLVIKFTDGTAAVIPNNNLPDWYNGSGAVLSGFDRTYRPDDFMDFNTAAPHLYRMDVNLSCTDQAKLVQSIMIINTTPNPTMKTAIFAVSGAPVVSLSSIASFQDLTCNSSNDGSIQIAPSGLTPLGFSWNTTPVTTTQNLNSVGAGNYTCTITDATGCTALLNQVLTEPAAISSNQTATICNGESFTVGSFTHTTPGTFNDTLTASMGCDSVVTTVLSVTSITNNVTISGHLLSTSASGGQYQWLDCNAGNAVIPGATGQIFAPTADGSYAVAVTMNNCTDTSSCIAYSTLGLTETENATISATPNPVTDVLTIRTEESIRSIDVIDVFGKKQLVFLSDKQLYMRNLPAGIYFVTIETDSGEDHVFRVIKQ